MMLNVVVSLAIALVPLAGARPVDGSALHLIPCPEKVVLEASPFRFSTERERSIGLADPESESDRFAASLLAGEIKRTLGFQPLIGPLTGGKAGIVIGQKDDLNAYLEWFGLQNAAADLGEEAYILEIKKGTILVAGGGRAGTFHGVQTLRQLIRGLGTDPPRPVSLPGMRIEDGPKLEVRAVLLDLCSGPIPTMDRLKAIIEILSAFKMNTLFLALPLRSGLSSASTDPWVDAFPLTPMEIEELAAMAGDYGIKVMGGFRFLPVLQKMNPDASQPEGDKTRNLEILFEKIIPCFHGPYFYLDCRSAGGASSQDPVITTLAAVLEKHRRRLLCWNEDTVWTALQPDEAACLLGSPDEPGMDASLRAMDRDFFMCLDITGRRPLIPDLEEALRKVLNRKGMKGFGSGSGLILSAGNLDGPGLLSQGWKAILFAAAAAWKGGRVDVEVFERSLGPTLFGTGEKDVVDALAAVEEASEIPGYGGQLDRLVFEDTSGVVPGCMDRYLNRAARVRDLAVRAMEQAARLRSKPLLQKQILEGLEFDAFRLAYVAKKKAGVVQAARAHGEGRYTDAMEVLGRIHADLVACRNRYDTLWLSENKPWHPDGKIECFDVFGKRLVEMMRAVRAAEVAESFGYEALPPANGILATGETGRRRSRVRILEPGAKPPAPLENKTWALLDYSRRLSLWIRFPFETEGEEPVPYEFALPSEIADLVLPDSGAFYVPSGGGAGGARFAQILRGDGKERLARIELYPDETSGRLYFNGPSTDSKIICTKTRDGSWKVDNGAIQVVLDPSTGQIKSWIGSAGGRDFVWFDGKVQGGFLIKGEKNGMLFEKAELLSWGPLLARFRLRIDEGVNCREMILDFPHDRPWVELFLDPGVPFLWNHLHPLALKRNRNSTPLAIFPDGSSTPSSKDGGNGFFKREDVVYSMARSPEGRSLALLTPGWPCGHTVFLGTGIPGIGCASDQGVSHAVLYFAADGSAAPDLDRLAHHLDPLRQGEVLVGPVEDRP